MRWQIFVLLFVYMLRCVPTTYAVENPTLQISEVFPNPVGDDAQLEWIELYNPTHAAVVLDGWTISDVMGAVKTFSLAGKTIGAASFLVLERPETGITLNNDQEQVVLKSPLGQEIKTPLMTDIMEGKSFSFIDGVWSWTDPTKNGLNTLPTPSPSPSPPLTTPSPSPSPQPTLSPIPTSSTTVRLSEIEACGSSEWVEVENTGDDEIALDDWKLLDATSVVASNLEQTRIPAHGFAVIDLPGFHLNNQGDVVRLQYGNIDQDQFAYDHCTSGKSWAKITDGNWQETSCITKGYGNTACGMPEVQPKSLPRPSTLSANPVVKAVEAPQSSSSPQPSFHLPYKLPLMVKPFPATSSDVLGVLSNKGDQHAQLSSSTTSPLIPSLFLILGGILLLCPSAPFAYAALHAWYNQVS